MFKQYNNKKSHNKSNKNSNFEIWPDQHQNKLALNEITMSPVGWTDVSLCSWLYLKTEGLFVSSLIWLDGQTDWAGPDAEVGRLCFNILWIDLKRHQTILQVFSRK